MPLFDPPRRHAPGETERALGRLYPRLLGVDEAGRGALCGPVVAAAVMLPPDFEIPGLNDSKKLSAEQRSALVEPIRRAALCWGVGSASAAEVDEVNVLQATFRAMTRAIEAALAAPDVAPPDLILVDGPHAIPHYPRAQKPVVKGDSRSRNIAAASILAKTHRDELMWQLHEEYPAYGLRQHVGYGTSVHRAAIATYGLTPHHRRTFCRNIVPE